MSTAREAWSAARSMTTTGSSDWSAGSGTRVAVTIISLTEVSGSAGTCAIAVATGARMAMRIAVRRGIIVIALPCTPAWPEAMDTRRGARDEKARRMAPPRDAHRAIREQARQAGL